MGRPVHKADFYFRSKIINTKVSFQNPKLELKVSFRMVQKLDFWLLDYPEAWGRFYTEI